MEMNGMQSCFLFFLYVGGAVLPLPLSIGRVVRGAKYVFYTYPNEYLLCKERTKGLSLFLLCCASGCRPFPSGIILPLDHLYLHSPLSIHGNQAKDLLAEKKCRLHSYSAISCILPPSELFAVRNPMEFGHNYLPEFTNSENGQFHPSYMIQNLYNLIRLPDFSPETKMSIPQFNGMNIIICFRFSFGGCMWLWTSKSPTVIDLLVLCCVILHILMLVSHKTMGGYHYGNRYIADTMPAVFTAICSSKINLKYRDFLFLQLLLLLGLAFNGIGIASFYKVRLI